LYGSRQQVGAPGIREVTRVRKDAALEVRRIWPPTKHRLIVVRFQHDQPGLGYRFRRSRRRTAQVSDHRDSARTGTDQESARVDRVMAHGNGYDLDVSELHRMSGGCFFPLSGRYIGRAGRTARAEDNRPLRDKTRQFPDVVAVLMADKQRVDVRHAEPDTVQRTQQSPHANPAVDQQNRSCRSQQESVSRAAAA
jgi:hypothetical protein